MRRSASIAVVTCLAFAWAVLWPDVSRADPTPAAAPPAATTETAPHEDAQLVAAKQHFEAGRVAFNAADYPTAIREFKMAEALRASAILAYNIGLANEKLNRRRVAVRYYRRFLESAPTASNRPDVEQRIARLEKEIAAQPQAQPVEQPEDNPPPPVIAPPAPGEPPPPGVQQGQDPYAGGTATTPPPPAPMAKKRSLWWVWVIVGVGGAALLTGIVLAVVLTRKSDQYYVGRIDGARLPGSGPGARLELAAPPGNRPVEIAPLLHVRF